MVGLSYSRRPLLSSLLIFALVSVVSSTVTNQALNNNRDDPQNTYPSITSSARYNIPSKRVEYATGGPSEQKELNHGHNYLEAAVHGDTRRYHDEEQEKVTASQTQQEKLLRQAKNELDTQTNDSEETVDGDGEEGQVSGELLAGKESLQRTGRMSGNVAAEEGRLEKNTANDGSRLEFMDEHEPNSVIVLHADTGFGNDGLETAKSDVSRDPREKRSYDDFAYLQNIGYDPTMAWGKRSDDSYLLHLKYEPMSPWGKKRFDDYSYLESLGYDPMSAWKKRSSDGAFPQYLIEEYMKKTQQNEPHPVKRSINSYTFDLDDYKRSPSEMGPAGFHEGIFNNNFGSFSPVKRGKRDTVAVSDTSKEDSSSDVTKRKFGMGSSGFHGDTFNEGWGGFSTMRKRRPEWDSRGFQGDTFSSGLFGDFATMKKRRPEMTSSGFYGDTFSHGFGDFGTMKKRRPEMTSSGFYGDTFSHGFGDFGTMKKRGPEMTSSGFYGDTFSHGFGDFGTMKKRRPEMTSSGFHGDMFSGGFGDFGTMKKRGPEMTSSGFFGDTFSSGFGDFSPMKRSTDEGKQSSDESSNADQNDHSGNKNDRKKRDVGQSNRLLIKRRPEMTSSGFYGDTFSGDFGNNFYTMKKRNNLKDKPIPDQRQSELFNKKDHRSASHISR